MESKVVLQDAVNINPKRQLSKGEFSIHIAMDQLEPFKRNIDKYSKREFRGSGSKFQNGDTLLARITPCLENGKTAYVDFMAANEVAHGSTEFIILTGKENITDNLFIYYLATSPTFRSFAVRQMEGTSGRQRVSATALGKYLFRIPNLLEQKAITHILGTLDDKIELNRQMNETLEAMAQAIFKSWFVDFDPVIDKALAAGNPIPPDLQEKAARRKALGNRRKSLSPDISRLFPDSFVMSELGPIPKEWEVSSIGEDFKITMGQSPPGKSYNENQQGLPFFQGRRDFGHRYPTKRVFCNDPRRIANKNDTLVSVRAPVGDVNMASEKCCVGRGVGAARHKSGNWSYTYYSMLQLNEIFNKFEADGTVFGSISKKDFENIDWVKSPAELIVAFGSFCGPMDQSIESLTGQMQTLTSLRDILLPKLLSGDLTMPEVEKIVEEEGI